MGRISSVLLFTWSLYPSSHQSAAGGLRVWIHFSDPRQEDCSGNTSPGNGVVPETFSLALLFVLMCWWLFLQSSASSGLSAIISGIFPCQSNWHTVAKVINPNFPSLFKKLGENKKGLSHSHVFLLQPRSHCQRAWDARIASVHLVPRCPGLGALPSLTSRGMYQTFESGRHRELISNVAFSFDPHCFEFSK